MVKLTKNLFKKKDKTVDIEYDEISVHWRGKKVHVTFYHNNLPVHAMSMVAEEVDYLGIHNIKGVVRGDG